MAQRVVVNIVSDAICPWCFVGKRRFEKAVAALGAAALVTVRWRPFFLDASLPPEGVDKLERYTKKFGAARVAQMLPMMQKVGAAEGIAFLWRPHRPHAARARARRAGLGARRRRAAGPPRRGALQILL